MMDDSWFLSLWEEKEESRIKILWPSNFLSQPLEPLVSCNREVGNSSDFISNVCPKNERKDAMSRTAWHFLDFSSFVSRNYWKSRKCHRLSSSRSFLGLQTPEMKEKLSPKNRDAVRRMLPDDIFFIKDSSGTRDHRWLTKCWKGKTLDGLSQWSLAFVNRFSGKSSTAKRQRTARTYQRLQTISSSIFEDVQRRPKNSSLRGNHITFGHSCLSFGPNVREIIFGKVWRP